MQYLQDPFVPDSSLDAPAAPASTQATLPDSPSETPAAAPQAAASDQPATLSANLEALNAQDPAPTASTEADAGEIATGKAGGGEATQSVASATGSGSEGTASDKAKADPEASLARAPPIGPPGASLIPFVAPPHGGEGPKLGGMRGVLGDGRLRWGAAAGLALIAAAGGAVLISQSASSRRLEARNLTESVGALQAKVEAMEAAEPHEEAASIRKAVAEARGGLATAHDLTASVAQLSARIDRLDHEATTEAAETQAHYADLASRIEKLERADFASRLDKLEKKSQATAAAATAPATSSPPPPTSSKPSAAPTPSPGVSNETTGSIQRPQPGAPIHGWALREIRNGEALVESRQGFREISPGDVLPGAGRVERFERRGREWVVVTDQGVIVQGSLSGYNGDANGRPPALYDPYGAYGAYYGGRGDGED